MLGKDNLLASELGKGQVCYAKIHGFSLPARIGRAWIRVSTLAFQRDAPQKCTNPSRPETLEKYGGREEKGRAST